MDKNTPQKIIYLFSGGGESEIHKAFNQFFANNLNCQIVRQLPIRPSPKIFKKVSTLR